MPYIMKNLAASIAAGAIVAAALIFGSGCGGLPPLPGLPESAMFEYDVAPELVPEFDAAAARILEASGLELRNVTGGTPLTRVDEARADTCGDTVIVRWEGPDGVEAVKSVEITVFAWQPGCAGAADTVAHELIHSLRRYVPGDGNHGHTASGLFHRYAGNGRLDEVSLAAICDAAPCTRFNPEAR